MQDFALLYENFFIMPKKAKDKRKTDMDDKFLKIYLKAIQRKQKFFGFKMKNIFPTSMY